LSRRRDFRSGVVSILRASAFAIPLRDKSIQTIATSPSYWGLRKYAGSTEDDLGREKTVALYVEHLMVAAREWWRVLRDDGIVFLNLGDTYFGSGRGAGDKLHPSCDSSSLALRRQGKAKSMCLIPQRVAIALADEGWIVRNIVVWQKPNVIPESVGDRCTNSYEQVILLAKTNDYCWNKDEAREPSVCWEKGTWGGRYGVPGKDRKLSHYTMRHGNKPGSSKTAKRLMPPIGNVKHQALGKGTLIGHRVEMKPTRNLRDVWQISTRGHREMHPAMMPEELARRCILLGSRPGDTVLDPFGGSGTTGLVARQLGRNAVLLDISEEYCQLMKTRLAQQTREEFESPPAAEGEAKQPSSDPVVDSDPYPPKKGGKQTVVVNQEFTQWARTYVGPKFHALLCDPPYGYHFMNQTWDEPRQPTKNQVHNYLPPGQRMTTVQENIAFQTAARQWGEAMLPLLYPGALVMMFAGTRMSEWLATGMQMAGFEHWDTFCWLHSQGFPKAQGISSRIDRRNGVVRESRGKQVFGRKKRHAVIAFPASAESAEWAGYKTPALKPAYEPILCFRAPRQGITHAELALKFGVGALNVDGGRLPSGRYPANLILDEESAAMLGNASRFYYCPKASSPERDAGCEDTPTIKSGMSNGAQVHGEGYDQGQDIGLNRVIARKNNHPCVKPLALTRYLATLLLPPASVEPRRLLVPFAGSGSEMIGALQAGWDEIVGVEQDAHYCEIAKRRLEYWREASIAGTVLPPSSPDRRGIVLG
jgi:DNA modification methylase